VRGLWDWGEVEGEEGGLSGREAALLSVSAADMVELDIRRAE